MNINPPHAAASVHRRFLLVAAIVLVAFSLRTPVTSIGPLLRELGEAGLSSLGASILTTLPSLCFGLSAFAAAGLSRRLGVEHALLAALCLMLVGTGLRGVGAIAALFLGQIVGCAGIGLVNVLLPSLVKRDFHHRVALITGIYVMVMGVGTAVSAGASVPLDHALGGWWLSLGFWALPVVPAIALWAACLPRRTHAAGPSRGHVGSIWRDPVAWQVTLFMGLQSSLAYIIFGWLAPIMRDRGLGAVDAGLVLSISVGTQAIASLLAPPLATRGRTQSGVVVALMALTVAALAGILYAPLATVWAWAVVLGVGQGGLFAVALTVIVLRSHDAHVAARLSGMAQGVGYLLASAGPLLAGLLHEWTHGWNAVALLMGTLAAGGAAAGYGAGRDRTVGASIAQAPHQASHQAPHGDP